MMGIRLLLLFAMGVPAFGQLIDFGIKVGVPLTGAYSTTVSGNLASTYQRPYIVGPMAEVHLPLHLAFEVDALYRRNGFETSFSNSQGASPVTTRVNDWEIPFLAKLEGGSGLLRPFVDGGVTYRHIAASGISGVFGAPGSANPNSAGISFGGGLTLKLLFVRVSPEIRFTHWGQESFTGAVYGNSNQADFLVGVTF